MARRIRKSGGRKRKAAGDGRLEFGLKSSDRTSGTPKRRRPPAKNARSRKAKTGRRTRRRNPAQTRLGRLIGRSVRTLAKAVIVTGVAILAIIAYYASQLPPSSEWEVPARATTVKILADNGELITTRGEKNGEALTLDELPAYLPQAVIAIEDRRFYWHLGIDPIGLGRAFLANWNAGGIVQGGSTLTQQLAKNLFLKPERTIERKVQEVILAGWLEARLSKQRILELYLNRVYFGGGAYGVDAAALRYFGKSARNITLAEAAMLAGMLKAPSRYAPTANRVAAEGRAAVVLAAMHEQGYIGSREASLAMSAAVRPVDDVAGGSGRYVADWVIDLLPGFVGKLDGDVIVDTTIDLELQSAAAKTISTILAEEGTTRGVSQGALVAMDSRGSIKALVGGHDYAASQYNRAVDARRQPGSAFKPFVYLTALEYGLIPETVRIDQPISIEGWRPKNYKDEYRGPVTLQSALALSVNTISAQLTAEVGPGNVAATARRLGIRSPMMKTPSIALGTSEVSLLDLTGAYVPFANGGYGVIPHVIKRIATIDGEVLYERTGSGPGRVVAAEHVGMMNSMLKQTLEIGTGRKAAIAGRPAAGKTGTSQDFRDAWFVGYTAELAAGIWFGNDDGTPTKKTTGGNLPAITWQRFMSDAHDGVAVAELPGNYRFRDPTSIAGIGAIPHDISPPAPIGGVAGVQTPVPPGSIGEHSARQPRRGFLQLLFGG
jgi:penicillin-binding protein 1A